MLEFAALRFVSAIMARQLSAAQHILIKSLLKEGFENKLIASEASCSVRAVRRIRLKQFEMPTPRTNRVGRRGAPGVCLIVIKDTSFGVDIGPVVFSASAASPKPTLVSV